MKITLILIFLFTLQDEIDDQYEKLKSEIMNKNEDITTTQQRLQTLAQNYLKVEELNILEKNSSFVLNKFSIMLEDELRHYTGYKSKDPLNQISLPKSSHVLSDQDQFPQIWQQALQQIDYIFDYYEKMAYFQYVQFTTEALNQWAVEMTREEFISNLKDAYEIQFAQLYEMINSYLDSIIQSYIDYIYSLIKQQPRNYLKYLKYFKKLNQYNQKKKNLMRQYKKRIQHFMTNIQNEFDEFLSNIPQTNPAEGGNTEKVCGDQYSLYCLVKNLELPMELNWVEQNKVTPVKDQGSCGACWAFATSAAMESLYLQQSETELDLSEQQLVNCVQENFGCDGGYLDATWDYVIQTGQGLESEIQYLYNGNPFDPALEVCSLDAIQHFYKVDGYITLDNDAKFQSDDKMVRFIELLNKGPITLAIYSSNFMYYQGGIMDGENDFICPDNNQLDHAVVAVGYFIDENNENNSYILFKNSWSEDWGEQGYMRFQLKDTKTTRGQCNSLLSPVDIILPFFNEE